MPVRIWRRLNHKPLFISPNPRKVYFVKVTIVFRQCTGRNIIYFFFFIIGQSILQHIHIFRREIKFLLSDLPIEKLEWLFSVLIIIYHQICIPQFGMICKCVTWFVSMALFCSPVLWEDVCKKEYMIQNSIIRSSPASAHQRKTEYCLLAISLGCITGCCHCKICQKLVDLILFPLPLYLVSMNCGSFDSNIQSFSCSGHYYREALRKKLVCQRSFQLGCSTKKKDPP